MVPKISVIIPVKNDENRIINALNGVFSQTLQPYEVIIVDGHSTDNTVKNAKVFNVRILYENHGTIGAGRQIGIENAVGDYIAFTDSDCIPETNWLENLYKAFGEGIVGVGGGTVNIGDGIWEKTIAQALDSFLGSANSVQDRSLPERKIVKSISGCNSLYRKNDLLLIGGFDVTTSINEDTIINQSLQKLGNLLYVPDAIVYHDQNRDLLKFVKRMYIFGYGRGKNRLFDLQIIPPIIAVIVLTMLIFSKVLFILAICVYMLILLYFTLSISLNNKNLIYIVTLPIVFMVEHIMYTIGFWNGILYPKKMLIPI